MSVSFLEKTTIQRLQDSFSETLGLYALCYQRPFSPLTECSGASSSFLEKWISPEEQRLLVASFSETDIENVIVWESREPFAKIRALAIRDGEGRCVAVWIFLGLCEELADDDLPPDYRTTTEDAFDSAVAMIERVSGLFFKARAREVELLDAGEKRRAKDDAFSRQQRRNDILDDLLTLLSSEREFSGVIRAILRVCGEFLSLEGACLIRRASEEKSLAQAVPSDDNDIQLVATWMPGSEDSPKGRPFDRVSEVFSDARVTDLPFFTGKPYTISSGSTLPEPFESFFYQGGLTAGVFLPINFQGVAEMYLCFLSFEQKRNWEVKELAFLNDAGKILELSYFTRIAESRFSQLYGAVDDILAHLGTGIMVTRDGEPEPLYTNEQFERELSDARDRQRFEDALSEVQKEAARAETPGESTNFEFFAEQVGHWYAVHPSSVRWVDGQKAGMYSLIDISESKHVAMELKRKAISDDLTGLYNRKKFMDDFEVVIRDAVRSGDCGALLYINLDAFKSINGGLGQTFGDALLKETAAALLAAAGGGSSCYRLGGDEFAVLVPFYEYENLTKLVGTIQRRFSQPWNLNGTQRQCTMSMGVVSFPEDGVDRDVLLKCAQIALDTAKKNGRARAEYFDKDGTEEDMQRRRLEEAMRRAVEDGCGEFEVYYQPMIDANGDAHRCVGAEALVRWNSRELGFVRPDNFIPMAEYTGMIVPIGAHILRTACRQCKHWNDFGHPDFEININVSGVQFMNDDIVARVQGTVEATGINPRNIILEITESVAIRDMEKLRDALAELRKMGIRISLDDFGTGYSSLNRLKELPLDEIKIDKSFVDDLTEDEFAGKFVETVTNLADTIDLNVVVEGVEKKAQANELGNMNVDVFQGYLFDKPLPYTEFEKKYL